MPEPYDDREPYDEQKLLQLLTIMEITNPHFPEAPTWMALMHQAKRAVEENIRLRNAERLARERLALLEQGQTLLPLSTDTATNQTTHPHTQP